MFNSGKKFRALRDKKNKYSNSCVVGKKNSDRNKLLQVKWSIPYPTHLISSTKMCSPKSLHNLQHDEGGNDMAETEKEVIYIIWPSSYDCIKSSGTGSALN